MQIGIKAEFFNQSVFAVENILLSLMMQYGVTSQTCTQLFDIVGLPM